jgi:A/G-specific adenine glycosylase
VGDLLPTTKKTNYTELHEAAVVVWRDGEVLVRQCGPDERWSGLWDFPRFGVESEGPLYAVREIEKKLTELTGITASLGPMLKTIKHGVTRYRITLDCYEATHKSGRLKSTKTSPAVWVKPSELAEYPLSTTGRKIAKLLA